MIKVLISHSLYPESFCGFPADFQVIKPQEGSFTYEELLEKIADVDAFIPMFDLKVPAELIKAGKNLKIISNVGVGYNNIDIKTAKEHNTIVCNTPTPVTEPTAELAITLMGSIARGIVLSDRKVRNSSVKWGVLENIGNGLYGKTLGIVGFGRIGQATARRAVASGMKLVYFSRNRVSADIEKLYNAEYRSLDQLLSESDFISLHTPLTEETHHLINAEKLSLCKPTAFIINTARGAVIDEKALILAMKSGKIKGAALDVYESEPRISEELLEMENVVLVPHIGTATREARNEMALQASENIINFFRGGPIYRVV
jgi:D-3-phosphoglycerate dehydrogenase